MNTKPEASDEAFAVMQNICSWGYGLLENPTCSYKILRKLCWKIWSVLMECLSPGKSLCVSLPFLVLLENLMCSYKTIMSSPGKFICFLIAYKPPGKFNVFFKKVTPGIKEQIF